MRKESNSKLDLDRILNTNKTADLEGWIGDARFATSQLTQYLKRKKKMDVLEIGCGLGFLLSHLKCKFPKHDLEGIEPHIGGFDKLKKEKDLIEKNTNIKLIAFADFKPKKNMM